MVLEILLVVVLALTTLCTRVYNLLAIPIFTDEAIYVRWAQIGLDDPAQRYISLTDGKQPLFTWLMYPMLKLFTDPLFAGRFVSVLSGVLATIGIYLLARELFGRRTAVVSALLYIITPFFLIYDRMALMDSLQSALGLLSLYLSVLLARQRRLDIALLLGMTIGLGYLTKSIAEFYIILLPVSLLLFDWQGAHVWRRLAQWVGLAGLSSLLALLIYNTLRLSPWFYLIKQKNNVFIMTPREFLDAPLSHLTGNLNGLWSMFAGYAGWPVIAVMMAGIAWGVWRRDRRIVYLFCCFFFPFFALAAFGKILFPRYLLFMVVPLYVIAAHFSVLLWVHVRRWSALVPWLIPLLFVFSAYQSYLALVSPVHLSIPQTDRNQFFDDWPSGYGVKDVVGFLETQAQTQKVVVGTEGTFGLFPASLEIYLQKNPNVEIHGYWPVGNVPDELMEKAKQYPTFLVFKDTQSVPESWPLRQIAKIPRGIGKTYLLFYQVIPKKK